MYIRELCFLEIGYGKVLYCTSWHCSMFIKQEGTVIYKPVMDFSILYCRCISKYENERNSECIVDTVALIRGKITRQLSYMMMMVALAQWWGHDKKQPLV